MVVPKRVYIVEDIAISRMSLETMLQENNYEVSGSAATAEIAWKEIQQTTSDIVLLDINLAGEKNGIWLAQQVRKHLSIPIVYLTAFGDQQTLKEVLDTKPNGYLMKPYQEATLLTTIDIVVTNFSENQKKTAESESRQSFIFIKDGSTKIKLYLHDILYVKSDGNYLEIKLENKTHVIRKKLLELKKELPSSLFFQSHQRYLINLDKITVLKKNIVSINDVDIPISQKHKKEMEALFPAV